MASHQTRPLTLLERLTASTNLIFVVVRTLFTIPSTASAVRSASWPLKRILAVSFLRNRTPLVRQSTHLLKSPTVGETIAAVCSKRGELLSTKVISCGDFPDASLHSIDAKGPANGPAVLYFHGGGYRNPLVGEGHIPVVLDCARAAGASTVILLEYTLTPRGKFPTQLAQAARALHVLLSEGHVRPDRLLLGGDSAGGNLVLALLAHLKQPHPAVPAVTGFNVASESFKGAFLISPWVSMSTAAASFSENRDRDYISTAAVNMFLDMWDPPDAVWADPLRADKGFWGSNVPVQKMIVTAGGFECFRDDIVAMTKLLQPAMGDRLSVAMAPEEVHVHCVVDTALKIDGCKSLAALLEWFGTV